MNEETKKFLKEELNEILDTKMGDLTEEMLKKSADIKKVEHLEKEVTSIESKLNELKALEKSQEEFKKLLEGLEKKINQPSNSYNNQNSDLVEYEKSFVNYLRKGEEIDYDIAKKAMISMYGEERHAQVGFGGNSGFILNDSKKMEEKTLSVDNDPNGGYLVRPEYKPGMVTRYFETTPMRDLAEVSQISTDELEILLDDDEFTSGGWVAEQGTRSVTANGVLGKITIPTHEQCAQPKITQKLLDDAFIDIAAWVQRHTNEIMTRTENTSFVTGNGSNKPKGLTAYPAWTTNGTYERFKLEHISSGTNGEITADGLITTQDSLLAPYQNRAVWMMNRTALTKIKQLKDGQGQYLLNNEGLREGFAPMLLGKPVIFSSDMTTSASFTTGTLGVAYGDFFAGYQIVDRVGIRVLRDAYTAKPYVLFYTTKRVGGAVKNFEAIKFNKLSA